MAVCTLFRDSQHVVPNCLKDRDAWQLAGNKVIHICVEGDSLDDTHHLLLEAAKTRSMIVEKMDFGTPRYPSEVCHRRFKVLTKSWNRCLAIALEKKADYVFILDSDIRTPPDILPRLLSHRQDIVAPMMFYEGTKRFRDTWGYWAGYENFIEEFPYHSRYHPDGLFELDGVGLPLMHSRVIADGARFTFAEEVRGLCREARALAYRVYVDPQCITYHPKI